MAWDDSDDDELEREVRHEERRAQGLDSDTEEEVEPEAAEKPVPVVEKVEIYVPLADKNAEKARQQKLQLESDLQGTEDLFGSDFVRSDDAEKVIEVTAAPSKAVDSANRVEDAFDAVKLDSAVEVVKFANDVAEKVLDKHAQVASGKYRFMIELLKLIESRLSLADAQSLDSKLAHTLTLKQVNRTEMETNKRKGNVKLDKNTKFNAADEVDLVYGGAWDGDWDDGDWDGEWGEGNWEEK